MISHRGLLSDAGFERMAVIAERKVYSVACNAALLDFRKAADGHPDFLHPSNDQILVEKQPGVTWVKLDVASFSWEE